MTPRLVQSGALLLRLVNTDRAVVGTPFCVSAEPGKGVKPHRGWGVRPCAPDLEPDRAGSRHRCRYVPLSPFTPPFHLEPEPCFTPDEPTPDQFIHGCIKTNGTIKVVNDPADCSDRETPISWLGE